MAKHKDVLEAERRIREAIVGDNATLDLSGLESLTSLSELDVDVAEAISVSLLRLDNTQISDLTEIAGMESITELSLVETPVVDLRKLTNLTNLKTLNLNSTLIDDLKPLSKMIWLEELFLANSKITDLTPLQNLTRIKWLVLAQTSVSDLSPLKRMLQLEALNINNTQVADLRILRTFQEILHTEHPYGLSFESCSACVENETIAQISLEPDNFVRARVLYDYLQDWVPPVPSDTPSARAFRYDGDGPITSASTSPETDDPDQRDLQKDLQRKVNGLSGIISGSNELGGLASSVDSYGRQINRPLDELRLKLLYSAANTLRVAYEAHEQAVAQARDMECLPPQAAAALTDLVQTHSLFFMGFPEGPEIHDQMQSGLTGQRQPDITQLASDLAEALRGQDDVLAPDDQDALIDDRTAAEGAGISAEIGERSLIGSLSNAFMAAGRFVLKHKGKFSAATSYGALKWMVAKEVVITEFLVAVQGPYAAWFKAIIELVKPWV